MRKRASLISVAFTKNRVAMTVHHSVQPNTRMPPTIFLFNMAAPVDSDEDAGNDSISRRSYVKLMTTAKPETATMGNSE